MNDDEEREAWRGILEDAFVCGAFLVAFWLGVALFALYYPPAPSL